MYRVVVVLESKVYIYNFQNLDCSDAFLTCENPVGLVSLSVVEDSCVLAIPDETIGQVKVVHFNDNKDIVQIKCH